MEAKKNAIHQQLDSLYDIRYNTITCKLEYKNKVDIIVLSLKFERKACFDNRKF